MSALGTGGPVHPPAGSLDELVTGGDPYECPGCAAAGEPCEFHAGWAAGWDACASFVAQVVDDERASELTGDLGDIEGDR